MGRSRKGSVRQTACHRGTAVRITSIQLCPGLLSSLSAHHMEALGLRGLLEGTERGGKERGRLRCRSRAMVPETDREELRWKQLLPLWPSAFIRRLKNRRHRVAQMPFIGQGSIAHSGLGRAPLIGPVSHLPSPGSSRHPQGRGSSWAQVAGRARIKNIGLGSERGAW